MYSALLDACVLVPNALCDTFLRLAESGFYRPIWSQRILDGTKWAITKIRPDIDVRRIDWRLQQMNAAFEDTQIEGWEQVCAGLDLPDPDDRHVWAAAIKGGAQTIVTFNLKAFPKVNCRPRTSWSLIRTNSFSINLICTRRWLLGSSKSRREILSIHPATLPIF